MTRDNSSIVFLIVVVCLAIVKAQSSSNDYQVYVDQNSMCTADCGTEMSPFSNFVDAIQFISLMRSNKSSAAVNVDWLFQNTQNHQTIGTIIAKEGIYRGSKNKGLDINFPLHIVSQSPTKQTTHGLVTFNDAQVIIDCEGVGNAITVKNVTLFKLSNIGIHRCVGSSGGALSVVNSSVVVGAVTFVGNQALNGGAVSLSNSNIDFTRCLFMDNKAVTQGYDIYASSSVVGLSMTNQKPCDMYSTGGSVSVKLDSSYLSIDSLTGIEGLKIVGDLSTISVPTGIVTVLDRTCPTPPTVSWAYVFKTFSTYSESCNNNNVCDNGESCFSCPSDCSCVAHGWKLEIFKTIPALPITFAADIIQLSSSSIANLAHPYAILNSYLKVNKHATYEFKFIGSNCGLVFSVDGIDFVYTAASLSNVDTTRSVRLTATNVHHLRIAITKGVAPNTGAKLKIYWRRKADGEQFILLDPFYSKNICNDGILDDREKIPAYKCVADQEKALDLSKDTCGDGICSEIPEDCLVDCYHVLAPMCPEQATPYRLDPIYSKMDFVGTALNNQYMYSLPGIQLLSHGVDIMTDENRNAPLFHFGYCDNSSYTTVHDLYRGLVYTVPKGILAIPTPKCSYSASTTSYSSSSKMSQEMSKDTSMDASANLGGSYWGVSVQASVAFSQSSSVKSANDLEKKVSGQIMVDQVLCETTRVHISADTLTFHPNFVRDVSQADTIPKMELAVAKYGSMYIKSAVMGGSLTHVTVVSHTTLDSKTSSEMEKHTQLSLSAKVSSPALKVNANYKTGTDNSITSEQQNKFEDDSASTTIITKGGPPGSFGPDTKGSHNNFGEWAKAVDLLPVPIKKKYGFISDLIPTNWLVKGSTETIQSLWTKAEIAHLYKRYASRVDFDQIESLKSDESIYYLNAPKSAGTSYLLTFTIKTISGLTKISSKTLDSGALFVLPLGEVQSVSGYPTSKISFDVYDVVNSRIYHTVFANSVWGQLSEYSFSLRIQNTKNVCPTCTVYPIIRITLQGTLDIHTVYFNPTTDPGIKHFMDGPYIGDIEFVSFEPMTTFGNEDVTFSYTIDVFNIVQYCPNAPGVRYGAGMCTIPANMPIEKKYSTIYGTTQRQFVLPNEQVTTVTMTKNDIIPLSNAI
ncbi:hypothetical protein DFA_06746 [Cavenderia fasciculata]|uniref:MACPF domain-containing protein n=1 Tax=Cavenderia fasciculata TaxID=261658 RepID=F4Q259_CACFS|nr:uncharacterized protein DFA_06746 [Cavenderia fasciculata]EGG18079.1 hypothetical protein DFA_06746 [Cavenderia fasciculata]|eukprot:XP_004366120.1 hypothetical protein DFA_06746 [Cavenderia fasciculata]